MLKPTSIHDFVFIIIIIPIIFIASILSHSFEKGAQASEPRMISVQARTSTLGPTRINKYRVNQDSDLYDKGFVMDTTALSISPMTTCLKRSTLKITSAALCGPTPPMQVEQHVLVLPCPTATLPPVLVAAVVPSMPGGRWEEGRWRRNLPLDAPLEPKDCLVLLADSSVFLQDSYHFDSSW